MERSITFANCAVSWKLAGKELNPDFGSDLRNLAIGKDRMVSGDFYRVKLGLVPQLLVPNTVDHDTMDFSAGLRGRSSSWSP